MRTIVPLPCLLAMLLIVACACRAFAAEPVSFSLPSIFSENMVLQRDMPVPVWGKAPDKTPLRVAVYDGGKLLAEAKTVAEDGRWRVELAALPTGGRYTLLIESGQTRKLFTNVLVGEVWIICGQSNTLWPIALSTDRDETVAAMHAYPHIRVAQVGIRDPHQITATLDNPQGYWGDVKWEDANYHLPRSSQTDIPGSCSAVGYHFARALYAHLEGKVPVGLIEIGAIMRVESWIDDATVRADPVLAPLAGKSYPNATSRCFNTNIAPLAPFPIRGALYYQGEMNAGGGAVYEAGLTRLIESWRKAWNQPQMPFLFVQLPGFIKGQQEKHALDMDAKTLAQFKGNDDTHGFIPVREAALRVWQKVPQTGMAVTIDLGEPYDIHPPRKKPVGERLFLQARAVAYGEKKLLASGPVPETFTARGGTMTVRFRHAGEGLVLKKGAESGFELAGADGVFKPAVARVEKKDTLLISAEGVSDAAAVRYAWKGYPSVTLYNSADLPGTPFRYPAVDWDAR